MARWLRIASVVPKIPYYKLLDRLSRNLFCTVFYRKYAGVERAELDAWAQRDVERYWHGRLYPGALGKLEEHRQRGHRIGIVSGSLEPVLEPLADALGADVLLATEPEVDGSRLTGRLVGGPLNGENKAVALRRLSDSLGIDLAALLRLWRLLRRQGVPRERRPPGCGQPRPPPEEAGQEPRLADPQLARLRRCLGATPLARRRERV